jgi:hypothetical protein
MHDSSPLQVNRFAFALLIGVAACRNTERLRLPDTGVARSPDGRVAFIRPTPGRLVSTSLGDAQATELWIADADGANARRLVVGAPADSVEHALAAFSSPRFSPDGRRVYFLSRAWVTSDAVHAVDVATGRERFVAPGNSLDVISRGPLAGCLIVGQHRYRPNEGGSFDWSWILDADGREVALAATDSDDADRRLAIWRNGGIPDSALSPPRGVPSHVRCS